MANFRSTLMIFSVLLVLGLDAVPAIITENQNRLLTSAMSH